MTKLNPECRHRLQMHSFRMVVVNRHEIVNALKYLLVSKRYLWASQYYGTYELVCEDNVIDQLSLLFLPKHPIEVKVNRCEFQLLSDLEQARSLISILRPRHFTVEFSYWWPLMSAEVFERYQDLLIHAPCTKLSIQSDGVDHARSQNLILGLRPTLRELCCRSSTISGNDFPSLKLKTYHMYDFRRIEQLRDISNHAIKRLELHIGLGFDYESISGIPLPISDANQQLRNTLEALKISCICDNCEVLVSLLETVRAEFPRIQSIRLEVFIDLFRYWPMINLRIGVDQLPRIILSFYRNMTDLMDLCHNLFRYSSISVATRIIVKSRPKDSSTWVGELKQHHPECVYHEKAGNLNEEYDLIELEAGGDRSGATFKARVYFSR